MPLNAAASATGILRASSKGVRSLMLAGIWRLAVFIIAALTLQLPTAASHFGKAWEPIKSKQLEYRFSNLPTRREDFDAIRCYFRCEGFSSDSRFWILCRDHL